MKFVSRLIPHARGMARGTFLTVMGVLALGFVASCQDNHIGRPCDTDVMGDAGTAPGDQVTIISSPALQCPSRICIDPTDKRGIASSKGEGAFCTAGCSTDDDCSDTDPGSACSGTFYCTWATTSGPFACEKLCICSDFIAQPMGGFQKPASCP